MKYESKMFHRGETGEATRWLAGVSPHSPGLCVGIGGAVNGRYVLTKKLDANAPPQEVAAVRDPADIDRMLESAELLHMEAVADWTVVVAKPTKPTKPTSKADGESAESEPAKPAKKAAKRRTKKTTSAEVVA